MAVQVRMFLVEEVQVDCYIGHSHIFIWDVSEDMSKYTIPLIDSPTTSFHS